ncbi:MAG: ATP-binding protein [Muribaculaceae bacterium]|jgi:hypothetical protein|nr:ATP-binding protein [Muribaculaceae bacterium]
MKYPIGVQDFEKVRNDDYLYIDKTALIYKIVNSGSYYFLSRPRRFGKSLLVSTIEAYMSGKKELFKGLAIENLEKEWLKYPILHLDLNSRNYDSAESLCLELNKHLEIWEKQYGDEYKDRALEERFYHIVANAVEKTGQRVVILVDEYDKPMLQAIGNDELQKQFRATLKAFYSVLKTQDRYIKFALLTGVTKFGKVSVFSDLNNLKDISMDRRYQEICGVTEDEIHANFENELHELAESQGLTYEQTCAKLRDQYDGYHFVPGGKGIYNPFSLLNTFDSMDFGSYWFETGTPSFLVELMKKDKFLLPDLSTQQVTSDVLNSIDAMSDNPVPVIYQSGYLTIKGYDEQFRLYKLGFPNKEVEEGFIRYLMPYYTPIDEGKTGFEIKQFVEEVERGDVEGFMRRLSSLFADTPYELVADVEKHYQNVLFIVFKLMGLYVTAEYSSSYGRADLVLKTKDYIYVMEFKLDGSADEALRQIEEKGYAAPFASDKRKLIRVGVNFSSEKRCIDSWKVE